MHIHLNLLDRKKASLCCALAFHLSISAGSCVSIIVPRDLYNHLGNGSASVPFDVGNGTARFQQVFDASQFAPNFPPYGGIGLGGAFITDIYFRVDQFGSSFETTLPNIQINLSTTAKAPDSLSPVFADNVGPNDTIVHGPGSLAIRSAGGPFVWDIAIPLSTPFFYQPSAGNLLMDIRNFGGGSTAFFDAQVTTGDSISGVQAYTGDGSGSVTSIAGIVHTGGLITLFEVTPVPEPGPFALLLLGFSAFAFGRWRAKRRHQR